MSFKATVEELRALGVPEAAIPGVVSWAEDHEAEARRESRVRRAVPPEQTRNGVSASEWLALRSSAFERDGFVCVYCGSDGDGKALHADHVYPRSRGGLSTLDNLATACWRCNLSKRDKTPEEWCRQ